MVHSSCLSPALGNSLCPQQHLMLQRVSRCTCLHLSQTRTMTETHLRGGVISHFVHSLTALLGVLQGEARRLAEPAVMHDGAWWGGGRGGCSFW